MQGFFKKLDFGKTINVCNEYHYNLTGLSYEQFEDLFNCLSSFPPSTVLFTRGATGLLLTQKSTRLSHSVLAILFGLTEIQESQVVASARKVFLQHCVSLYLGFLHISCPKSLKITLLFCKTNFF